MHCNNCRTLDAEKGAQDAGSLMYDAGQHTRDAGPRMQYAARTCCRTIHYAVKQQRLCAAKFALELNNFSLMVTIAK